MAFGGALELSSSRARAFEADPPGELELAELAHAPATRATVTRAAMSLLAGAMRDCPPLSCPLLEMVTRSTIRPPLSQWSAPSSTPSKSTVGHGADRAGWRGDTSVSSQYASWQTHYVIQPRAVAEPCYGFDTQRGRSSVGRALDWQSRGSGVRVPSPPRESPGQRACLLTTSLWLPILRDSCATPVPALRLDGLVQPTSQCFIQCQEQVPVGAERHLDRRVPQALHDRPRVRSFGDEQPRVGVA